jgi:hypothetical protein
LREILFLSVGELSLSAFGGFKRPSLAHSEPHEEKILALWLLLGNGSIEAQTASRLLSLALTKDKYK